MPSVLLSDLDKPHLIERIKSQGSIAAQYAFLNGYDNKHLVTIAKKVGSRIGRIKSDLVRLIVEHITNEQASD
jgi:hypothetical protein